MPVDLDKIRALLASVAGFTAGPWRVSDPDPVAPTISGQWRVAVVTGDDDGRPWDDEIEPGPGPMADARLIAAAPDLHRELTEMVRVVTADRDARVADVGARIADAVAAERHAIGAWLRTSVRSAPLARNVEHGDHINDDAPPLPSLRMTLLLRDELHRQIKALEAERDRRIDPVEHARAVHGCFIACFAGALMEYGSPLPQARMLAGGLWLESAERAALLARVGADVLAEVER